MASKFNAKIWNSTNIADAKQRVKSSLDEAFPDSENQEAKKQRLKSIILKIKELENESTAAANLDLFIYCMSALVHHERHGGLTPILLRSVAEIAQAILASLRIDPQSSRIGFIYSELYLIRSQIKRKEGSQWMAAWEQQVSDIFSGRETEPQLQARQTLATAFRHIRMGHGPSAMALYRKAYGMQLPRRQRYLSHLAIIQLLRLQGEFSQALREWSSCVKADDLQESEKIDLAWEKLFIEAQMSESIVPLLRSIQPRGSHHLATYFVEGFLWKIAKNYSGPIKLPVLDSVARPRNLNVAKVGLFRAATAVEQFSDTAIPLIKRLDRLGACLSSRQQLISLDKELLLLAAAGRVLDGQGLEELASLVWLEYRKYSLMLSAGKTADSLSVGIPQTKFLSAFESK